MGQQNHVFKYQHIRVTIYKTSIVLYAHGNECSHGNERCILSSQWQIYLLRWQKHTHYKTKVNKIF